MAKWQGLVQHGVANCILGSQVVSGNSDFFSLPAGLTLRLIANATDPFEYDIAGHLYRLLANVDLTVTDNAHNFIWIDDNKVTGVSALPPTYSFTAPGGPATNQHWFDLGHSQMMRWNGAAWAAVSRIFIGYVRADAGALDARYVCQPAGLDPFQRLNLFGDGSDGFLDLSAGTTTIDVAKQYTAVVARGAAIITQTGGANSNGIPVIYAQNSVVLLGTSIINWKGKSSAGGAGAVGTGAAGRAGGFGGGGGGGGGGTNAGGNGGGNARSFEVPGSAQTAGGGSTLGGGGANGSPSLYPPSPGLRAPMVFTSGGTGGGGGGTGSVAGGNSGQAGGGGNVITAALAIAAGASIDASGNDGTAGSVPATGGGGGGGGGVIVLLYRSLFNSGTVTVAGGNGGGAGGAGGGAGGSGGTGLLISAKI